jgi:NADPH:quinone reductase-like Zn-dependent oxidoreductase/malonyl CoA-acyl carrier protein transacylase
MAISYYRGTATIELKKRFPALKGSMMAVGCSKEEIAPLIAELTAQEARIACFNSPESLTISGDEPAIDELQAVMEKKEMFNRKLQVDVAYHSHHMKLVAKSYLEYLQALDSPKSTDVRFHSSLLGHVIDGSRLEPSYWVDNLTESVRFAEALTSMCEPIDGHKTGVNMIVEIGPHSALAGPVKQILKACGSNATKIPYASALIRKRDAVETAQELASALFMKGATLKLGAINLSRPSKPPTMLVDMPRYPWNHQTRYWHESRMAQKHRNRAVPRNDILGTMAKYSNDMEPIWRNILKIDDLPWLQHHQVQSLTLLPISGFIAMALEAASQRATARNLQYDNFELRDITISTPLMIGDDGVETTLQLRPYQAGSLVSSGIWDEFRIHSWAASKGWTEHCRGIIATKSKDTDNIVGDRIARETEAALNSAIVDISNGATVPVEKTKLYHDLSELGVSYGSSFQGMNNCHAGDGSSTASITVMDTAQDMPQGYQTSMVIHPAVLEQIMEMYWPILGAGRTSIDTIFLPSSIGRMTVSRKVTSLTQTPGSSLRAFCKGNAQILHPKPVQVSLFATGTGDSSEALVTVDELTISPILDREMSAESEAHRELCYKLDWEPILSPLTPQTPNGTSNGTSQISDSDTNGASHFHNGYPNGTSNGVFNGASHSNGDMNGESKEAMITSADDTSRQNGHHNGICNGVSNGTSHSNGHHYGNSNGLSNGTIYSNGHRNGQHDRHLNGTASGLSNGSSHVSNGVHTGIHYLNGENNVTLHSVPNGVLGETAVENIFPDVLMTIVRGRSEHQINLASRLADVVEFSTGKRPNIGTLVDVETENRLCLFIFELDRPLLSTLTTIEFAALQKLLTSVRGLLWVVRGAYVGSQNPDANMVTGLSRSIRSETLLKFATLDLDSQCVLALDDTAKAIMKVFEAVFSVKADENCELEFMERNGAFFTPRIINDDEMNAYVHKQITASVLEPTRFVQNDRPLKMVVENPGAFNTVHFVDQPMDEIVLEDEIEIEVKAIGMNPRDVAVMMGQHDTYDCGVECSGKVTKVGTNVTNYSVGDRVAAIALSGGVYSTYARTKAAFVLKISDHLSYDDAASVPIAYCTAHYGLLDLARLENGERVFIHGAGSPAGQAAVSLAQMVGAEIFATVGNSESKLVLMNAYSVREDHIFSSHTISSGPAFCRANGHGRFDVVLNCLPTEPDTMREVVDCLDNFGRFVDLDNQQGGSRLDTSCFQNNRSLMSVDLISMATERPKLIRRLMSDVGELLMNSRIRPVASITAFPISDIEQAFKMLQSGKTDAKLVVAPRPGEEVKVRVAVTVRI